MKAVLYNDTHPYYGILSVPLPIPPEERDQITKRLESMKIGKPFERDCWVDCLIEPPPAFECLESTRVNLYELDDLARRLESLFPSEMERFQNVAVRMKPSNITDLRQMLSDMKAEVGAKKGADTFSREKELIITKSNEELNDLYLKEVSINLRQIGFTTQPSENDLEVSKDGRSLCRITPSGGVRYREEEVSGEDRQAALDKVVDTAVQTAEYMRQMEAAPQLTAESLQGDYRLLAEFNNTVLAGHPTQFGVQFITWEWVQNRTSLWRGDYYGPVPGCYAAAKQDFATRSGLVPKSALFTPEQLTEVYRSVHETLDEREPLTDQRRELLEKAAEQIERGVPDLTERVNLSNQQELELGLKLNRTEGPEDSGMQFC